MAGSVFGVLKDPFPLLGGRLDGRPGFLTLQRKIQPSGASISPGGRQKPGVERRVRLGGGSPLHRVIRLNRSEACAERGRLPRLRET